MRGRYPRSTLLIGTLSASLYQIYANPLGGPRLPSGRARLAPRCLFEFVSPLYGGGSPRILAGAMLYFELIGRDGVPL
jgi:hypothetical protein